MPDLDQRLTAVRPSPRQAAFQQLEFYAFVHYTVNTYTGREWGDGTEDPAIFDPTEFDPAQWVEAVKSAGMRGLILTCKHHDGFCLWPSKLTGHTVAKSPFRDGCGDMVREVAEACRTGGLKFGVYLSPWDRSQPCYGSGKPYDDFFVGQLTELLTGYGDIFTVWFDGACGEGPNGRRQVYDWDRYYAVVRKYQPNACINVCGPDIRWCGNEAGSTRESEWSVVPLRMRDTEKIASASQQADDTEFRQRELKASDRDLGSRTALAQERELIWYPAEVNTSIRPGWFYHPEEDGQVKSVEQLFDVYLRSVGGNASFLLNIPPAPNGRFHPNDVARLRELGQKISHAFSRDLGKGAALSASSEEPGHGIDCARERGYGAWFRTPLGQTSCAITIRFPAEEAVRYLVMQENILDSQRIEKYHVTDGEGKLLAAGTVVGYQKILPLPEGLRTQSLTLHIDDARQYPTLAFLGAFGEPLDPPAAATV